MRKGDTVKGPVQLVSGEVRQSKKGQPFTGLKIEGRWFQVWGDRTALRPGQEVELEVSWIASDDGPIFCVLHKNGSDEDKDKPAASNPDTEKERPRDLVRLRNLLVEAFEIASRLEAAEAMKDDPPPKGMPF